MKGRDIVIGLIVLAAIAAIVFWYRKSSLETSTPSPSVTEETQETFETNFGITLPEDAERATLEDVMGGSGSGIATRRIEGGIFMHTVLADLPDPEGTTFYEGWLVRGKMGDSDFHFISTGKMQVAKGGFLLNFESSTDYSDYTGVVITLETVFDATPEEHILEGSF